MVVWEHIEMNFENLITSKTNVFIFVYQVNTKKCFLVQFVFAIHSGSCGSKRRDHVQPLPNQVHRKS